MASCPACAFEVREGAKFCDECGARVRAVVVREERKVITALFCDLVGSTALGERMDHEDVARLQSQYQEICRRLIESHGGVVEKFIGDAVVGVFGVPVAHEDDPERAVRAGLRIVEEMRASDLGLAVRIGINTGEALVRLDVDPRSGEGFATGDALNTAARLEAAAPEMAVVVGAVTRAACEHAIVLEELEPIPAKGKAEPVAVWRALEPRARSGSAELHRTPFVGRELELSMLTQLFDRSRTRSSVEFVTIIAEPGLGKSRLVAELRHHVDAVSDLIAWREGRCLSYGDGISFCALGEIVKAQAGILESDGQASIAEKLLVAITEEDSQVKGWLTDRLAPLAGLETSTAPPEQQEAFNAWRTFLESMARQSPTVLVIEDLHWADDAFVAFLNHLAERAVGVPMLVVVTARPEVEERHPSWPPRRRSTVLPLAPLDDTDLAAFIAATMGGASEAFTRVVLERAGGSPLFAEQLAAMLREQGSSMDGDLDSMQVPTSVQALIAARIDSLPAEAKQVLMQASVVGRNFWPGAVAAFGAHADLEASLAELVRRELCRPVQPSSMAGEAEFSFWHALVRDVAYAQLTKAERARMHVAAARWISADARQALGEHAEIVVHHLNAARDLGSSEDTDDLLRVALVAAGRSAMRTNLAKALEALPRALDVLGPEDPQRVEIAQALGHALLGQGRYADSIAVLEPLVRELIDSGEPERAVDPAIDLHASLWAFGEWPKGSAMLERLWERLDGRASASAAVLLASLALDKLDHGSPAEAVMLAQRSVAIAGEAGAAPPPRSQEVLGLAMLGAGDPEGEVLCRRASAAFLAQGHAAFASVCLANVADTLMLGAPRRSLAISEESIEFADRSGVTVVLWASRAQRLVNLALLGRFDVVVEGVPAILDWSAGVGDHYSRRMAVRALARVEADLGRGGEELARLLELGNALMSPSLRATWAWLLAAGGDLETAKATLREELGPADERDAFDLTQAAVAIGEPELARQVIERLAPSTPAQEALRSAAVATLAEYAWDLAPALDGYRTAAETFGALGLQPDQARTLAGHGRCLLALGAREEGISHLRQARDLWVAMKANRRIAEVDELLAAAH